MHTEFFYVDFFFISAVYSSRHVALYKLHVDFTGRCKVVPKISEQEKEMLIGTLRRLVSCREKKAGENRILWLDKEDPTDTPETFKSLDALYSFVLASEALNDSLDEIRNTEANDDALGVFLRQIDEDFSYTFDLIKKDGFFPIPYLWQLDKPFDSMDMAAFCCEFCISVLKSENPLTSSESTIEAAKLILKKSINTIKRAVNTVGPYYAWKGWGIFQKQKGFKTLKQTGTTYFTAICCSALSKYITAWDMSPDTFNMDFSRDEIISYIKGGLKWVLSRYNGDKKAFYRYNDDNKQALYWGVFTLIAVCDAKPYFDVFRDIPIFETAEMLWKDILAETSNRILNNRELYDRVIFISRLKGMDSCFRRNDNYRRFLFKPGTCFQVCHSWLDQESSMRKSIVTMKYKEDTNMLLP
ncbi:hypothetical protein MBAV_006278 [Candidatus Magnetobacterium bavaricum]|uniref:Uncharacterized protein n=1 Tax=Candidatus Magnetobacterium bavaricum TaxID=29290 RepID=A0A0F3GLG4_9BACT|nr:hypothetical protein MBAV_006278 [Candidatus Magnetobacterium bavaricum]